MDARFYHSPEWRAVAALAIERDGRRCTVSRLLGGSCSPRLHAHHLDRAGDPLDVDNVATACDRHHPRWEAVRRAVVERRPPRRRRCPHQHRYPGAREACERRLNAAA